MPRSLSSPGVRLLTRPHARTPTQVHPIHHQVGAGIDPRTSSCSLMPGAGHFFLVPLLLLLLLHAPTSCAWLAAPLTTQSHQDAGT